MLDEELILWFGRQSAAGPYIEIPSEIFDIITPEQAELISERFSENTLIMLPEYEIKFFEWLKSVDEQVWNDLWANTYEEPYIVGISYLSTLLSNKNRGFPICDLLTTDNYYFTPTQLVDQDSDDFISSSQKRLLANEDLSVAQILALEIYNDAIDIWHFAYSHKINLQIAKNAVNELVDDKIIIHLKDASHLANFIE